MSVPEGAIWVRLPRFIGDAVMISQALEPLRAEGYSLVGWGSPALAELFEGSSAFSAVVADAAPKPGIGSMASLLRQHRAAAIISLARSQRATLAGLLAGTRQRVGWSEAGGWLLNTHSLPFQKLEGHQIARYRALLEKAFPEIHQAPWKPFSPSLEAQHEAERLLKDRSGPFWALGMGARSWNKRVGKPVWCSLGKALAAQGTGLVLLGAKGEDQDLARQICEELPGALDLSGKTNLAVSAAILRHAEGVVGGDSALCHLAGASGVPTVVIFGPTNPAFTSPDQPWVQQVSRKDLPCVPCLVTSCVQEGHPCMNAVPAEAILQAMKEAQSAVGGAAKA